MSYIKPSFRHPGMLQNDIGYTPSDYEGAISTLCAGCGHDSISTAIMQACYEMSIEPHRLAKVSGIGCSSKAPTYFLTWQDQSAKKVGLSALVLAKLKATTPIPIASNSLIQAHRIFGHLGYDLI
jgi:TPP-dependent indolepyruvate ferredoxin oxidoreductase alpha subunit